jgi:hypothetical protein
MARQVIDGRVTAAEARRRLGGKTTRTSPAAVAKMQGGAPAWPPQRYPGELVTTDDYLLDAIREPMPRPGVTKAAGAGQVPREDPQRTAKLLKSHRSPQPESAPARPVHWSPAMREMLLDAEYHHDPAAREAARKYLVNKGMLWGEPAPVRSNTGTVRVLVRAPGPDGESQSPTLAEALHIAPPGSAGR